MNKTYPQVPNYLGDTLVLMELWEHHGGSWHGPCVETVTMPLSSFGNFVKEVEERAGKEALAKDKAWRMGYPR